MSKTKLGLRTVVLAAAGALALSACGGGSSTPAASGSASSGGAGGEPQKGGTINVLTLEKQFLHLDPQRNYTGVDLAFANGYLQRTLTAYKFAEGAGGATLVPDLATTPARPVTVRRPGPSPCGTA